MFRLVYTAPVTSVFFAELIDVFRSRPATILTGHLFLSLRTTRRGRIIMFALHQFFNLTAFSHNAFLPFLCFPLALDLLCIDP